MPAQCRHTKPSGDRPAAVASLPTLSCPDQSPAGWSGPQGYMAMSRDTLGKPHPLHQMPCRGQQGGAACAMRQSSKARAVPRGLHPSHAGTQEGNSRGEHKLLQLPQLPILFYPLLWRPRLPAMSALTILQFLPRAS